jgi:hypothetical protein
MTLIHPSFQLNHFGEIFLFENTKEGYADRPSSATN